jgi:mannose-1-phosphate guanylyltransferase
MTDNMLVSTTLALENSGKIKWSICHNKHRNLFTRLGQKSILVSHGLTRLGNKEDTCAIGLVARKSHLFPIAKRYKKCATHKQNTHILQEYHFC